MQLHKTKLDIDAGDREKLVDLLNQRLADVIDLKTQAKQAHWNVKGMSFRALHELFDEVATVVEGHVDLIAERATALGGVALGTARQAAQRSGLQEYPLEITDGAAHVDALSTALADCGKAIRRSIDESTELGDQDTADVFTEVSRDLDKYLWMVEAHIQA